MFRDGRFTGDCVLKKPELNQPLVLLFGIDGDIKVFDRKSTDKQTVVSIRRRVHKNLVTHTIVHTHSIKLSNSGNVDSSLDLKIVGVDGWTMSDDEAELKDGEITAQIKLPKGETVERTFVLSKETVTEMPVTAVSVLNDLESGDVAVDDEVMALVKEHRELTTKIDALRQESSVLASDLNDVLREQSRLSQQLLSTKEETDLGRVYADKLLAGEKRLPELRSQIDQKNAERAKLETTRNELDAK